MNLNRQFYGVFSLFSSMSLRTTLTLRHSMPCIKREIYRKIRKLHNKTKMPHLRIETNISTVKIPKDLPAKLCHIVAQSLGKPINYCVATIVGDVNMSWGGTDEPAAQATLMSIGALGRNENKKHSKAIFEAIGNELGIPNDRMYITFSNVKTEDVGYNGTTFHEIFGS